MPSRKKPDDPRQPSDFEMQILSVLWEQGPCTVKQVIELLPDGKQRAYTSVLSVMQVMTKKGLLTHERKGQAYLYSAVQKRAEVLQPFLKRLLNNVFGGNPAQVLQCLLESQDVDEQQLKEIKQVLKQANKNRESNK